MHSLTTPHTQHLIELLQIGPIIQIGPNRPTVSSHLFIFYSPFFHNLLQQTDLEVCTAENEKRNVKTKICLVLCFLLLLLEIYTFAENPSVSLFLLLH